MNECKPLAAGSDDGSGSDDDSDSDSGSGSDDESGSDSDSDSSEYSDSSEDSEDERLREHYEDMQVGPARVRHVTDTRFEFSICE